MALNLGSIFYQLGVDTTGLNKANQNVKHFQASTNRSFESVNKAAGVLKTTLASLISIEALRRSTMLADDYALLQDRIVSVVGDVDKAAFTFRRLEQISGKTGAALTTTAGGFQKLSFAKDTVKGTDEEMIRLTQSFAELGLISGTATAQLDAAMLQFSQGLITGTFQAQEFQSVLENVPAIAPEIAKGMGITVQELIALKKEGKLVSEEVFRALVNRADEISAKAEEMPIRLNRGFARFTLGIQQALSEIDKANGLTQDLGRFFFEAGEKIQQLPLYIQAITLTLKDTIKEAEKLNSLLKSVVIVTGGMLTLAAAIKTVQIAFAMLTKVNVFFILATAVVYLIDQTIGFQKALSITAGILNGLLQIGKTVFGGLYELITGTADAMLLLFKGQFAAASQTAVNIKNVVMAESIAITDIIRNTKSEIESILTEENADENQGVFSNLLNFDPAQLDIMQTFNANIKDLQAQHDLEMAEMANKAAADSVKKEKEKSYAIIKLEQWKNNTLKSFSMNAGQQQTDIAGQNFRTQIDQAAQHAKEFAALQKALVLFDLAVKTPQAIGDAYTFGNSIGGPLVGVGFAAVAGAAMGAQIGAAASQTFTPRAVGGDVSPGGSYLVGEHGPEILNMGSARGNITTNTDLRKTISDINNMKNISEKTQPIINNVNESIQVNPVINNIIPAIENTMPEINNNFNPINMLPDMQTAQTKPNNVIVNVMTLEGTTANVTQSQDDEGNTQLDVIMERVDSVVAEGIQRGNSQVSQSISSIFGLNRATGAAF